MTWLANIPFLDLARANWLIKTYFAKESRPVKTEQIKCTQYFKAYSRAVSVPMSASVKTWGKWLRENLSPNHITSCYYHPGTTTRVSRIFVSGRQP